MSALTIIQEAATEIGIEVPSAVFSGSDRTIVEVRTYLNEAARMVAFDSGHDWVKLMMLGTFTGDGVSLGFSFPSDYQRMLKKAKVWPSATPFYPLIHYSDVDQWLGLQVQQFQPVVGAWTIIGSQMQIRANGPTSPVASGDTVQFYYITNKIVTAAGGGSTQAAFTADGDTFVLSERLLKRAFVYAWKKGKRQDYSDALADYEDVKSSEIGNDKGTNILIVGRQRVGMGGNFAFPGVLGT